MFKTVVVLGSPEWEEPYYKWISLSEVLTPCSSQCTPWALWVVNIFINILLLKTLGCFRSHRKSRNSRRQDKIKSTISGLYQNLKICLKVYQLNCLASATPMSQDNVTPLIVKWRSISLDLIGGPEKSYTMEFVKLN